MSEQTTSVSVQDLLLFNASGWASVKAHDSGPVDPLKVCMPVPVCKLGGRIYVGYEADVAWHGAMVQALTVLNAKAPFATSKLHGSITVFKKGVALQGQKYF